jgi:hypothetical protein
MWEVVNDVLLKYNTCDMRYTCYPLASTHYPTNNLFVLRTAHRSMRTDMASAIRRSSQRQFRSSGNTRTVPLWIESTGGSFLHRKYSMRHTSRSSRDGTPTAYSATALSLRSTCLVYDECAYVISWCLIEQALPEVEFRRRFNRRSVLPHRWIVTLQNNFQHRCLTGLASSMC